MNSFLRVILMLKLKGQDSVKLRMSIAADSRIF